MTVEYRILYVWVEGRDDAILFENIIKPLFHEAYDWVAVRPYASESSEYITNFIRSVNAMPADYIFVADINLSPCITHKKQRLQETYNNLDENRIQVVIQEIESWYLAGLDDESAEKLGLRTFANTDNLTKEQFNPLMPKRFDSRIDFMSEILKYFSIDTAQQKNRSFSYFIGKYQ